MKKIYHLGNCDTCQRIIKQWKPGKEIILQNIKEEPITSEQLEQMQQLAGSYESLFSRIALKYRALKLSEKTLTESDYRNYILQEYTFLKRPVLILDNAIYIGNAPKTVEAASEAIRKSRTKR